MTSGFAAWWRGGRTPTTTLEARYIYTSSREIELWQFVDGAGLLIGMVKLPLTLAKNTEYTLKIAVKGQEAAAVYHAGLLVIQTHTRPGAAQGTSAGSGRAPWAGRGTGRSGMMWR